ncbi:MAG: rod shape-determining protein MreC [Bacteroidota bacterium]
MRNLFVLLWKNQFFILFILLEIISLTLITRSYSYHGALAHNTTNDVSGSIFSIYSDVTDYFNLKEDNQTLAQENALLRSGLPSSYLLTDTQYVYRDSMFKYIPAKVISNSISGSNNFTMVNKGSKHGVKKEMGVVSSVGVVGVVIGVSKNYATIMPMLHKNMRISARIKKSGQLVSVIWDNNDYLFGTVIDIPSHIVLMPGDTIVTSGNSLIFQEGIVVGTIDSHKKDNNKKLSKATLRYITDFGTLKHVYLIDNLMKVEQDSLINQIVN